MIAVKIQCGCGQRYAFDVEPVGNRMPSAVACPVCGADGTPAANAIIARSVPVQPVATVAPTPGIRLRTAAPATANHPVASTAPAPTASPQAPTQHAATEHGPGGEGDTWKWWYYVLAGICIAGYDIWKTYDTGRMKYLGGLFLAALCIAIGIWDFQRKRKQRMGE